MLALAAAVALALPTGGVVVPGKSLGGVPLGSSPAQVRAAWGSDYGRCRSCADTTWYFTYRPYRARGAGVAFRRGRAVALFTLWAPRGWRTTHGLRIGDAAARITEVYGPLARVECGRYYALSLPGRGASTAFYVVDNRLWGFGVMRPRAPVCR